MFYLIISLISSLFDRGRSAAVLVGKGHFKKDRSNDRCDNNYDYYRTEVSVIHKSDSLSLVCYDKSNFTSLNHSYTDLQAFLCCVLAELCTESASDDLCKYCYYKEEE